MRNPADKLALEAAVNGQAESIVTLNRRDFGIVPEQFGMSVLTPAKRSGRSTHEREPRAPSPLRLQRSVKAEVERHAKSEGISVNQFVATAVAENLAAMNTAEFFAQRCERADFAAFDRLMRRKGGVRPQTDHTIG